MSASENQFSLTRVASKEPVRQQSKFLSVVLKRCDRSKAWVPRSLGIVAGLLLPVAVHADIFALDDGSPETWGGTRGGDFLGLNHFNTGGQTVVIDQISVCWNPLSSLVSPRLALYSDPNADGDPSDLRLLQFSSVYIQPGLVLLNQSVQDYSIPPTTLTGSFFVGACLSDADSGFRPRTGIDTTPPNYFGQSWIIENSGGTGLLDLNNPIGTSTLVTRLNTYINGNFIIEAHYTVIPEPSIARFFPLGLLALPTFRRSIMKRDQSRVGPRKLNSP